LAGKGDQKEQVARTSPGALVDEIKSTLDPVARYLQRIPQPYGRHRWYFICPSSNRRCSVLFKPPGAKRFRAYNADENHFLLRED
jgi:hypothetical protein